MQSEQRGRVKRIIEPVQAFISTEVSSGIVLLVAASVALVWASSPWDGEYANLFSTDLSMDGGIFHVHADLRDWINEALMALFFYVAALEIKREFLRGELAGREKATLPIVAALGGMIAPALIYTALNAGSETGRGWGIPMATDIAFALGILALLGRRIPAQLRIFLLALAIVDDMGAIFVIAVFYSSDVQFDSLALAVAFLALIWAMQMAGVRVFALYVVVAAAVWIAVHSSGVHATIAGVALGFLTPLAAGKGTESPLERIERMLHPVSSFVIVPLFALANAGIPLDANTISDTIAEPVTLGVALGLIVGKPFGICAFTWIAVRTRLASLPSGVDWRQMIGTGALAGIGFTVALFIDELAFQGTDLEIDGRLGILCGSLVSGVLGYALLRVVTSREAETATEK